MTYKKERLINTFKIKAFIAVFFLIMPIIVLSFNTTKAYALSNHPGYDLNWIYNNFMDEEVWEETPLYLAFKGGVSLSSNDTVEIGDIETDDHLPIPDLIIEYYDGGWGNFAEVKSFDLMYGDEPYIKITKTDNSTVDIYGTFGAKVKIKVAQPDDTVAPVLSGETSYITSVANPILESAIRSQIRAYDDVDGDITGKIQLISDNYTTNKAKLGIYEIEYQVKDSADNVANLIVKVSVVDVTKPTITGTAKHTIGYKQTLSLSTIKSGLTATDNYDLTPTITLISDNYSTNKNRVGVYDVKYQAEDSSGNKSDVFTVTVTVVDTIKPTITGKNTYTAVYNNKLTIDSIKSGLQAQDEHDGDITNNITLKSDGYSSNFNVKGNYQVIFTVSDASGNSIDYTVTVTVVDTIKPTITGKNNYVTGSTQKINESTIREALTAIDDYDGALSLALISDNYSSNYNIIGNYQIKYRATDASGNYMDYIVTVTVTDDVPPIFYVTDHFVNVDQALNMTLDEIIQHLILIGEISADTLNHYQITASNYMSSPGNYEIELSRKIDAPSTLNEKITIGVKVVESTEVPEPPTTPIEDDSELGFGDKFEAFFKEYGAYIVIGFIGLIVVLVVIKAINPSGRKRW